MSPDRTLSSSIGSLLTGENLAYLEAMLTRFKAAPHEVGPEWHLALSLLEEHAMATFPTDEPGADIIRKRGHFVAALDPIASAGRQDSCGDRAALLGVSAASERLRRLADTYCGAIGVETEHIDDERLRRWIYAAVESREAYPLQARDATRLVIEATEFERLMQVKFPTKKRFGAEGAEAVVPLLRTVIWRLAMQGIGKAVIATMHRGRLNLLTNALAQPLFHTLSAFAGKHPFGNQTAADVPYHFGWETTVRLPDGLAIDVEMLPNPSHLEAVNPVAMGKAKGLADAGDKRVATIILHTDASVIGQGSVAEIVQLAGLEGYSTGGTIHIVINNQIGFTTDPVAARTSRYCTGAWKAVDSLIVHVNGEDIDAVIKAAGIGTDYRCAHDRDAVIDLVCYRRNGHNEIDEPRFTQPVLYREIDAHPTFAETISSVMVERGIASREEIETWRSAYADRFLAAYDAAKREIAHPQTPDIPRPGAEAAPVMVTGIDRERLTRLVADLATPPVDFVLDHRLSRIIQSRRDQERNGISWPLAEALAIASLNGDGIPVRLTGQDVVRGAFSQRHFEVVDQVTGDKRLQIRPHGENRSLFAVHNSPLSEYSVLGFEYGYSLARPDCLTIWEAQFGDFANGAQIVIDQFIASAKEKWNLDSGLVLLLPHGLDGQGPEHSSARIERFLQLSQPETMDVVVPSTPANYFHILRAQAMRADKRPLALMGAKALLRHPAALSPARDFGPDSTFLKILISRKHSNGMPRGVIFCSGKIFYDLERHLEEQALDIAVIRMELLSPFPETEIVEALKDWRDFNAVFLQEEPANMGSLEFVRPRLEKLLSRMGAAAGCLERVSRPASGSPAGSFHGSHDHDQAALIERALQLASQPEAAASVQKSIVGAGMEAR